MRFGIVRLLLNGYNNRSSAYAMPLDDCPPPYSRLESESIVETQPIPKFQILKIIFVGTTVTATLILLSGVILGAVSLDAKKVKTFSVSAGILTLLGVMMLIATVPCCFYFWFRTDRPTSRSRTSSRRSSVSELERPSIVSDLYPEEFRIACTACLQGTCRARHSDLPPPYDAPPPYSPTAVVPQAQISIQESEEQVSTQDTSVA